MPALLYRAGPTILYRAGPYHTGPALRHVVHSLTSRVLLKKYNVRSVLSERVAVKGRGRRPLFIFIIIYNLDVGVRAASVITISSSVSAVIRQSVCYPDIIL